ncbi:MAG: HAD hydrolase-like protein [Pseudomonadota bacterium]|nr:HAD hydrolase-like protein [Pseudomonadota bacterium]
MRAVLWDLDGTLIDSAGDIAAAVDRMLVRTGRPPLGEAVIRGFIGEGARKLVDRCVEAAGSAPGEEDLRVFMDEYGRALVVQTRVYAGLRAVLEGVRGPMAIVTNKPEAFSRTIVDQLDLSRYFPVVLGGDTVVVGDVVVRKPDPAPLVEALRRLGADEGVMVGDGPADVGAARAARMPMIGVGWGIAAPAGADRLVTTPEALVSALRDAGISFG